jgi:hypothetical protein
LNKYKIEIEKKEFLLKGKEGELFMGWYLNNWKNEFMGWDWLVGTLIGYAVGVF